MGGQERQSEGGGDETGRRLLISDEVGAPARPGGRSSDVRRRGRSGSGGARAQARGQRRSSGLRGLLSSRWSMGTRARGVAGRCLGSTPARGVADWSSGRSARDELLRDTGTRKRSGRKRGKEKKEQGRTTRRSSLVRLKRRGAGVGRCSARWYSGRGSREEEVAGLGGSRGGGGLSGAKNEGVGRDRLGMGGWIWEDPDGDDEWAAAAETRGIWWMGQSP